MDLCERLLTLRKKAGLSQEELANKLGVSRQAISKWESGQSSPDINNIIHIGEIYNVSTDYILIEKKQEQNERTVIEGIDVQLPNKKSRLNINGYVWLGLGVLSISVLYFITNLL
ncbi:helix-turn-helix domain-containing protein [Cellulosilyticum sp. I15G10I2]|uniref:helix-turn-helix domain-containing protein n=1 Tax=Cellulosilyticum sp. I15G10I2 TaxID=1892843 RepID=UPI00085C16B4|nr:helix-turn-helix transcriptional regulator [Cellulosilyticum sp. I15G10I2]